LKTLKPKKSAKQDRERQVLFGLIELYLSTGKPIGSNTLKETGFNEFSSATIRNYFALLEKEGYLNQQHTSGGRIPTTKAIRLYAKEYEDSEENFYLKDGFFKELETRESHEIAAYLSQAAEQLSHLSNTAVFLSAPRFDQDFIIDAKLVAIDTNRCLCVLITSFGVVQTEILPIPKKLSSFSLKRLELYFKWRLNSHPDINHEVTKPENLEHEEELLAQQLYNEVMVRYIVNYANFTDEDVYRTGFSKLLSYQDFQDSHSLINCLSLFENAHSVRLLLKECSKKNRLQSWIGEDLISFSSHPQDCAVVAVPYYINNHCVGAVGILGPTRLPYRKLFAVLRQFSDHVSQALTNSVYKHKITFRQAKTENMSLQVNDHYLLSHSPLKLIENKH
jgi:heat-inducible transcriptional repressor